MKKRPSKLTVMATVFLSSVQLVHPSLGGAAYSEELVGASSQDAIEVERLGGAMREHSTRHPHHYNVVKASLKSRKDVRLTTKQRLALETSLADAYSVNNGARFALKTLTEWIPFTSEPIDELARISTDGHDAASSRALSVNSAFFRDRLEAEGISREIADEYIQEFAKPTGLSLSVEAASKPPVDEVFLTMASHAKTQSENGKGGNAGLKRLSLGTYGENDLLIAYSQSSGRTIVDVLLQNNENNIAKNMSEISVTQRQIEEVRNSHLTKVAQLERNIDSLRNSVSEGADVNQSIDQLAQAQSQHNAKLSELNAIVIAQKKELLKEVAAAQKNQIDVLNALVNDRIIPALEKKITAVIEKSKPVYIGGVAARSDYRKNLRDVSLIGNSITTAISVFGSEKDAERAIRFQRGLNASLTAIDSFADLGAGLGDLSKLANLASLATNLTNVVGAIGAISSVFGGGGNADKARWAQLFKIMDSLLEGQRQILSRLEAIDNRQRLILSQIVDVKRTVRNIEAGQLLAFDNLSADNDRITQMIALGDFIILDKIEKIELTSALDNFSQISREIDYTISNFSLDSVSAAKWAELNAKAHSLSKYLSTRNYSIDAYENALTDLPATEIERLRLKNLLNAVRIRGQQLRSINRVLPAFCRQHSQDCLTISRMPEASFLNKAVVDVSRIIEPMARIPSGKSAIEKSGLVRQLDELVLAHSAGLDAMEKLVIPLQKELSLKVSLFSKSLGSLNLLAQRFVWHDKNLGCKSQKPLSKSIMDGSHDFNYPISFLGVDATSSKVNWTIDAEKFELLADSFPMIISRTKSHKKDSDFFGSYSFGSMLFYPDKNDKFRFSKIAATNYRYVNSNALKDVLSESGIVEPELGFLVSPLIKKQGKANSDRIGSVSAYAIFDAAEYYQLTGNPRKVTCHLPIPPGENAASWGIHSVQCWARKRQPLMERALIKLRSGFDLGSMEFEKSPDLSRLAIDHSDLYAESLDEPKTTDPSLDLAKSIHKTQTNFLRALERLFQNRKKVVQGIISQSLNRNSPKPSLSGNTLSDPIVLSLVGFTEQLEKLEGLRSIYQNISSYLVAAGRGDARLSDWSVTMKVPGLVPTSREVRAMVDASSVDFPALTLTYAQIANNLAETKASKQSASHNVHAYLENAFCETVD